MRLIVCVCVVSHRAEQVFENEIFRFDGEDGRDDTSL